MRGSRRLILLTCTAFIFFTKANSQGGVTIGSNSAPNSSAVLDLQSTSRGLLPPRMSATQRKAIASPAPGLVVFDTDANQLFLYDGSLWQPLSTGGNSNNITPSQQALNTSEQIEQGFFGSDVSMSDGYAAIGSMRADSGTSIVQCGAVYIYKKGTSGAWSQVAKLSPPDAQVSENFGASVAMAGNFVVVGAPGYDAPGPSLYYDQGKVYIFVKGGGDTWTLQTSFNCPNSVSNAYFGFDVALTTTSTFGAAVVVGSPYHPGGGNARGAAYTYRLTSGTWAFEQQLLPNPSDLADGDVFGWAVSIDGDYCAASAPYQTNTTGSLSQAGATYMFVYGGGQWFAQQKLQGMTASAQMGFSLSLKGNLLAAGAPFAAVGGGGLSPAVRLYKRNGGTWGELSPVYLLPYQFSGDKNYFGASVAIENDVLMVGMPNSYRTAINYAFTSSKGYVVVFKNLPFVGGYSVSKLINDDDPLGSPTSTNLFGNAVSLKNGNYIIGIPGKTVGNKVEVGAVAFGYFP